MNKWIKYIFSFIMTLFIIYNIYLSAMFVMHGEVHLTNDIGRDFLLLQELDQKKIVLIGPRTNVQGAFHGVLWTYLNYPAFVMGHGNPVIVAWFWVIIGIVYLLSSYYVFSRLFDDIHALLGTAMLSPIVVLLSNSLFGQLMIFFLIPIFIFGIFKYIDTKKPAYLILHLFLLGCMIQFNIGVGTLIAIQTILLLSITIIRSKLYKHFFAFIILPISTINFIIFDIRHNFSMIKALAGLGGIRAFIIPINEWLLNRLHHMVTMQLFSSIPLVIMIFVFILIVLLTLIEIKKGKLKNLFLIIIYYYLGYIVLTFFNKGIILIDHIIHLAPLAVIWLVALTRVSYKYIFIPLIILALYLNFTNIKSFSTIGKIPLAGTTADSWISLQEVGKYVVDKQKEKEFGYYVYSPDAYAYQQRYAMSYYFKYRKSQASEYFKKPITYVIIAPPPHDNPYMTHEWWIINKAMISNKPVEQKVFPSGYKLEMYQLNTDEQRIPHVSDIELGIHFR